MNRKYGFLFIVVFVMSAALALDSRWLIASRAAAGGAFFNGAPDSAFTSEDHKSEKLLLKEIYKFNFTPAKVPIGNVNTYLPKYKHTELDGAIYYFSLLGIDTSGGGIGGITETDDYFSCSNGEGTLCVYKFGNLLSYEANGTAQVNTVDISGEEALAAAARFIESRFLFLSYEEAEVSFDGTLYTVRFINRVGNIRNYAFATSVTVDTGGVVRGVTYYYMSYEKLSSVKIKSMESAADELPVDFPAGTSIELNQCSLVYTYEDSVVQPAYLFEGVTESGDTFQCFIKAALYE